MPGKGRPPQAIPSPISRHIITCYVRYQGSKHSYIYTLTNYHECPSQTRGRQEDTVVLYTIYHAVQSYSSIQPDEEAMTSPLLWVLPLPQVLCRHYKHYWHCIVPCYNGTNTGLYQAEMTPICCELHHFLRYYVDITDHSGYNSSLIKIQCVGWLGLPAWNGLQLGVILFGKIV